MPPSIENRIRTPRPPVAMRAANAIDNAATGFRIHVAQRITKALLGTGSGVGAGLILGMSDEIFSTPVSKPLHGIAHLIDLAYGRKMNVRELMDLVLTSVDGLPNSDGMGNKVALFCGLSKAHREFWQELTDLGANVEALDAGAPDMDATVSVSRYEVTRLLKKLERISKDLPETTRQ